jgi:selenocysteine lyase/cysteine desulfurase
VRRLRRTAAGEDAAERPDFAYLPADTVYLDAACQSMRPVPVIETLDEYFRIRNACGGRASYESAREVDAGVADTRDRVLRALGLTSRTHAVSFTLNTTYGVNLLLMQLPAGRFRRVVTTATEHNAVFLSTIAFARARGIDRVVLERDALGALMYRDADLTDAVVVISAQNNVDGAVTVDLAGLVADVHRLGGVVIVDAAQAMAHAPEVLRGLAADAICFSAHKAYGPSLGVVVAMRSLLMSLEVGFVGGGQVAGVTADDFVLLDEPHTRLEPGLQAWGEILAFGAALRWREAYPRTAGESIEQRERRLTRSLRDGLREIPNLTVFGDPDGALVPLRAHRVDSNRLAVFLSKAGISARSGYFCAHYWLRERERVEPLLRFSLGAHNTEQDVARCLDVLGRMLRGL